MYIVDLECEGGHKFEGWYDSAAELFELEARGEVTCPLCEAKARRVPTASRVSTSKTRPADSPSLREPVASPPMKMPLEVQKALAKVIQHVRQTHEDVGDQFAERALAMHRGLEPHKPIRGEASPSDEERLVEEGVPFLKLPVPDIERN
jgi:hypothetical protein